MENNNKKSPKIGDYPTTKTSPFFVEVVTRQYAAKPEHKTAMTDDGELMAYYTIPKNHHIIHDPALYTKHYKGISKILMTLTESATKMYYYIHEHLVLGRDEVCIIMEDYLSFAGYKSTNRLNYYRAIEGLLAANIIARKTGSTTCFYINPNILFNGDRTKLANTRVITNKATINTNNQNNYNEEV